MKLFILPRFPLLLLTLMVAGTTCLGQEAKGASQRQAAIALEQEGKTPEAETAWRVYLQLQPSSAEAYAHLGFLEARQQHYKEAIPLYRKASALDSTMPGLQMNLGLALFKADQLQQAIQIFQPLLENQPQSSQEAQRLTTLIGLAHYGLEQYAAAVPYLKKATASDPQNLPFRLVLAHSCLAAKQYQCVLDVYHQILMLNAESAEADMLAGEAMDEMNDAAGAIQQFRAAVRANPKEPNVHFGLGYLLWTQHQYEAAAQEFQAELENVPNHIQALVYLADSNIKMSRPEVALPLIKKALQLDPESELAHLDLGILHSDAGRREAAVAELEIAARLNPNDVNVHWRLARLYQVMGKKEEAEAEFQKTKKLTKAADESVLSKIGKSKNGNAHAQNNPDDQPAGDPSR